MKLISHRGNINGIISNKENRPSYIDCALQLGYDVEVDIRYIEGNFWLGHDTPDYIVESKWIECRADNIWFHCKNIDAVYKLKELNISTKYFCHVSDPYVCVSTGHLWVHDLTGRLDKNSIIPLLSLKDVEGYSGSPNVYAVCTDYINYCKYKFKL